MAVALLFSGCDTGSSPSTPTAFTPTTIDFEINGSDIQYYTDDDTYASTTHSVWYGGYSSTGDVTFTLITKKVNGDQGDGYSLKIYNADQTDDYFLFVISDYGRYHLSCSDSGTIPDLAGWTTVSGVITGINVSHSLTASYVNASGDVTFSLDGTDVYTFNIGTGASARPGLWCYTGTPSESKPCDYRFRMTSPFVSP